MFVPWERVELSRLTTQPPQDCVSTNSTTTANFCCRISCRRWELNPHSLRYPDSIGTRLPVCMSVPKERLELSRLTAHAPEACLSTNFSTLACVNYNKKRPTWIQNTRG